MARTSTARRAFASVVLVALPVAAACSGSPVAPAGNGDDVVNDTRDAQPNPVNPTPADGGPEASTGPIYGEDSGPSPSYPGLAECGGCTCAATVGYCFGGATPAAQLRQGAYAAEAGAGDAGLPACPLIDAGPGASDLAPQLGCNPLPAGCTDCPCIINLLGNAHVYKCDLVCATDAVGKPMTVYCPSP
jgi:hypothetical protein